MPYVGRKLKIKCLITILLGKPLMRWIWCLNKITLNKIHSTLIAGRLFNVQYLVTQSYYPTQHSTPTKVAYSLSYFHNNKWAS